MRNSTAIRIPALIKRARDRHTICCLGGSRSVPICISTTRPLSIFKPPIMRIANPTVLNTSNEKILSTVYSFLVRYLHRCFRGYQTREKIETRKNHIASYLSPCGKRFRDRFPPRESEGSSRTSIEKERIQNTTSRSPSVMTTSAIVVLWSPPLVGHSWPATSNSGHSH